MRILCFVNVLLAAAAVPANERDRKSAALELDEENMVDENTLHRNPRFAMRRERPYPGDK
jgi:hypothetical protein